MLPSGFVRTRRGSFQRHCLTEHGGAATVLLHRIPLLHRAVHRAREEVGPTDHRLSLDLIDELIHVGERRLG
jgi:hypothetical protein